MLGGACSPEELETLFEDSCLTRDRGERATNVMCRDDDDTWRYVVAILLAMAQ